MISYFYNIVSLLSPSIAYAATDAPKSFVELVARVVGLIDIISGMLVGVALIVFFWGLIEFIAGGGDKNSIEAGKQKIKAGFIGIFVIVSVWALVKIIISSFGFDLV